MKTQFNGERLKKARINRGLNEDEKTKKIR